MTIKITRNIFFTYVFYEKTNAGNFDEIKKALNELTTAPATAIRDVVIDVSRCKQLVPIEIGAIAKILTYLERSNKSLRLIVNPEIAQVFDTLPISQRPSFSMYTGIQAFLAELKATGNNPLTTPTKSHRIATVHLEGNLKGDPVKKMAALVERALKGTAVNVVLDMGQVTDLDDVCIGQLLHLDIAAKQRKKFLVLSGLNKNMLEVFKAANIEQLFTFQYTD